MRTVVAWLWIGASCAFQACGEALIVFFTYIMTKEGRDCVFGAFAPRLNLYGQRIFWGGLGVIFIMASIKIVITRVRVARFKKLESDNQMLTEKYEAGLSKLKDVERLVPNALKGILESLKSELALSLNARVSLYLVEMVKGEIQYFCFERCAGNLAYEKKCCRLRPLTKMFQKLWSEGVLFDNQYPNPDTKKGFKTYCQRCKKEYGLSAAEVQSIGFKGRSYVGRRIDFSDKHLAFLVVSSLDPDVNDMEQSVIMQVVSTACQKLGAVINAFREFIPTPLMTQEQEGF